MTPEKIRTIAFYLPQYHPVPENDEWWGKGFTEWTNVTKAKPQFPGHYQPHLPSDLGFYDLRLPEARESQADLAREYGIHGFCYYHYWFNGRRILEKPFNQVLESGKPDFPFCLCWANENWTRTWSGGHKDILLEQHYNHDDDLAHIRSLIPAFRDPRYIKVNGKPLFLVYRSELLPDPAKTCELWREEARQHGFDDLYIVRVESFTSEIEPSSCGFDAAVEFAPDWRNTGRSLFSTAWLKSLAQKKLFPATLTENNIIDYDTLATAMMRKPDPTYTRFPGVTPSWDNSARRNKGATILINSTPDKYEQWLANAANRATQDKSNTNNFVFINAWNEWAEGNHLEPDQKWGHAYLEATLNALRKPTEARDSIRQTPYFLNTRLYIKYLYNRHIAWRLKSHSS